MVCLIEFRVEERNFVNKQPLKYFTWFSTSIQFHTGTNFILPSTLFNKDTCDLYTDKTDYTNTFRIIEVFNPWKFRWKTNVTTISHDQTIPSISRIPWLKKLLTSCKTWTKLENNQSDGNNFIIIISTLFVGVWPNNYYSRDRRDPEQRDVINKFEVNSERWKNNQRVFKEIIKLSGT